mmetsp:Transcript_4391/g.6725  ORF Transcript_4391/g.6725 Transcript_4391/m.6725 type:complete len:112 (+) Transcript_4391:494-829(+)
MGCVQALCRCVHGGSLMGFGCEHAGFPVIGRTPECSVRVVYDFCGNVIFASDQIWLYGALLMQLNPSLFLANCQICLNGSACNDAIFNVDLSPDFAACSNWGSPSRWIDEA